MHIFLWLESLLFSNRPIHSIYKHRKVSSTKLLSSASTRRHELCSKILVFFGLSFHSQKVCWFSMFWNIDSFINQYYWGSISVLNSDKKIVFHIFIVQYLQNISFRKISINEKSENFHFHWTYSQYLKIGMCHFVQK